LSYCISALLWTTVETQLHAWYLTAAQPVVTHPAHAVPFGEEMSEAEKDYLVDILNNHTQRNGRVEKKTGGGYKQYSKECNSRRE